MLYLIGLGLGDEKDITVNGLEAVRKCAKVFLEAYTSVLGVNRARLERFYGRPVTSAIRVWRGSWVCQAPSGAEWR